MPLPRTNDRNCSTSSSRLYLRRSFYVLPYLFFQFLTTRKAAWYIISVVSVCLYVCIYMYVGLCQTLTFESLGVKSSYLHIQYISREYGSSSYMKVIGSRSRSQEHKRSQMPVDTLINFRQQFSSVLARWRHVPRVAGDRALYSKACLFLIKYS